MERTGQREEMESLAGEIAACQRCALGQVRHHAVPGEGPADAEVVFIGEAPGWHEDQQARPFVGPAGQLLDQLLTVAGLQRSQVYITNIIKCRPPNNRDPLPGEIEACGSWLEAQLGAMKPRVIVTLGRYSAARYFPREPMSRLHGRAQVREGVIFVPMYHPAAALHQQNLRATLEADFRGLHEIVVQARALPAPTASPEPSKQLSLL